MIELATALKSGNVASAIYSGTPSSSGSTFATLLVADQTAMAQAEDVTCGNTLSSGVLSALFDHSANGTSGLSEMAPLITDAKAATAELQAILKDRFAAAGFDTSQPYTLTVARDGSIQVMGDHADADAIEAVFADDPDLANAYRATANANDLSARVKVASQYDRAWSIADDAEEREKVWRKEMAAMSQLDAVSGQMTFSAADGLVSAEMQFANSFTA